MRFIKLDASKWATRRDVYDAILPALGAPDNHGGSRYGLVESMVWGEMNAVEPPYVLQIEAVANLPADVVDELLCIGLDVAEARAEFKIRKGYDVDVAVELPALFAGLLDNPVGSQPPFETGIGPEEYLGLKDPTDVNYGYVVQVQSSILLDEIQDKLSRIIKSHQVSTDGLSLEPIDHDDGLVRTISIDASAWRTSHDLYKSFLPALGAPDWHGENANALIESIVWGEINRIEPPYILRVHSTSDLPHDVAEELGWVKEGVEQARAAFNIQEGRDVKVAVEILR